MPNRRERVNRVTEPACECESLPGELGGIGEVDDDHLGDSDLLQDLDDRRRRLGALAEDDRLLALALWNHEPHLLEP